MMTGPGTNTYLYGRSELAVFDAGPLLEQHVKNIVQAQEALNAPITRLFSSHTHSDHSPAVARLKEILPNAEIIGRAAPVEQQYEDLTFRADVDPADGQVFAHDGQSVQAIHTPGHVDNHFCYLIHEHGFLTTGDHLMNGSTVVIIPPKGNMLSYIRSLQKLADYQIDWMGPGHGAIIEEPRQVVEWTIKHRLERETKVVTALADVQQATVKKLVSIVYKDTPVHLHPIAEMSLHAHLIKLQEEEKVAETEGIWEFIEKS